jgi:hypothetical protein
MPPSWFPVPVNAVWHGGPPTRQQQKQLHSHECCKTSQYNCTGVFILGLATTVNVTVNSDKVCVSHSANLNSGSLARLRGWIVGLTLCFRYHRSFVANCNAMDEIWVPTDFSRDVLADSGGKLPNHHVFFLEGQRWSSGCETWQGALSD